LQDSVGCLQNRYHNLKINGIAADFLETFRYFPDDQKKIICFFGSTFGNLSEDQASWFMRNISLNMQKGDLFIIGLDMVKDKKILEEAYNDKPGITEDFNKNILNTVNSVIDTEISTSKFEHLAFYNDKENKIEMHLLSKENQTHESPHIDEPIAFGKGERIHTENSRKFTEKNITDYANLSGLKIRNILNDDPDKWFSIVVYEKPD
jgi:L-histidine N-alpha-methyltransferase